MKVKTTDGVGFVGRTGLLASLAVSLLTASALAEVPLVWLDIGPAFLDETGWVPKSLMADEIHPTDRGYEIWMKALAPVLTPAQPET